MATARPLGNKKSFGLGRFQKMTTQKCTRGCLRERGKNGHERRPTMFVLWMSCELWAAGWN